TGDLAEGTKGEGHRPVAGRLLGEGKARRGAGLDGVGLLAAEQGGAVVLVALRVAAGEGKGERGRPGRAGGRRAQAVQEVKQVLRVLPGDVEADDEVHRPVPLDNTFEALPQEGITRGRLGEGEFVGGRLEVVAEEGSVVTVAGGVDADGKAAGRL